MATKYATATSATQKVCVECNKPFTVSPGKKLYDRCPKCGRAHFKALIRDRQDAADEAKAAHAELWAKADAAGKAAAEACTPTPMIVGSPSTPLGNDIDPSKPTYYVPQGVCGFAWIVIHPGNCSFANWVKKNLRSHKHYYGGWEIWVSDYGQCYEKKVKYAEAAAKVIRDAGIKAYAGSRLD